MTSCPICGGPCIEIIYGDFLLCPDCRVAVRAKETIPTGDRKQTYGHGWVEAHSRDRDVAVKTDATVGMMKTLVPAGSKILDVGCASGILVDKLTKAGYDAGGIDWSEDAILFAKANMAGTFTACDADLTAVAGSEVYDMIIATHIMEHLEDCRGLLSGVHRLLKPDAYLYIAVPNLDWYKTRPAWRQISSIFDPDHVISYSPRGLVRVLRSNGFNPLLLTTKTHGTDLLTVACVAYYRATAGKNNREAQGQPRSGAKTTDTALHRIYGAIQSSSVMSVLMSPLNRISERHLSGMELVVLAKRRSR